MEVYNLLSSVAVRIPQHVTVQLAANVRQTVVVSETLYEMRNNALFCDTCIIGSDRRSLNAHACILAAVCPALQSQLTRKHQTNSTNICISTDSIDSIMWEKVLKLIYCAEVQLPVCDLVTFLDITRELDIKGVQVLYVPVMPLKKGCNLCFVNPGNDNPVHERHSTVNDAYFSRSASNDDSNQDQDIVVDKEGVGFGGDELKPDALVDSRSRVEALQSFEGADGTPSCLDNLTSLPELSDNNLQSTSVSPPVTMDVKQERDVEVNNRDKSSAAFIQSENKQSKAPDRSCLLTCKTEPTDSHEDMPQWCSVDSISAIQESDVLAEAFVSSGLMSSTDVFNRSQFFTSEHDSHSGTENHRPHHTTSTDTVTAPRKLKREKRFTCDICQRSFGQMSDLQRHHRVHTGERPYSCNICGVRFTQSPSLKRHLRLLHGVTVNGYLMPHVDVTGVKS